MIRKLLILLCLLTLMLNGCASEKTKQTVAQENNTEEDSGEKKIQIGLTVDSFVIERWIRDRDAFVATARELGAEVNVQDAGADTKRADQPDRLFYQEAYGCDRDHCQRLQGII